MSYKLPEWVKPGMSFSYPGAGGPHRFHIRAIVDGEWIVLAEWWQRKRRWNYKIVDDTFFEVGEDRMTDIQKSKGWWLRVVT